MYSSNSSTSVSTERRGGGIFLSVRMSTIYTVHSGLTVRRGRPEIACDNHFRFLCLRFSVGSITSLSRIKELDIPREPYISSRNKVEERCKRRYRTHRTSVIVRRRSAFRTGSDDVSLGRQLVADELNVRAVGCSASHCHRSRSVLHSVLVWSRSRRVNVCFSYLCCQWKPANCLT